MQVKKHGIVFILCFVTLITGCKPLGNARTAERYLKNTYPGKTFSDIKETRTYLDDHKFFSVFSCDDNLWFEVDFHITGKSDSLTETLDTIELINQTDKALDEIFANSISDKYYLQWAPPKYKKYNYTENIIDIYNEIYGTGQFASGYVYICVNLDISAIDMCRKYMDEVVLLHNKALDIYNVNYGKSLLNIYTNDGYQIWCNNQGSQVTAEDIFVVKDSNFTHSSNFVMQEEPQ